jgi:hypothetical protein
MMAPNFLNALPTELRLQIFKDLLWPNGSTGFICIKYSLGRRSFGIAACIHQCEFDMCPLINLSILGTCKRINSECKELLWQRNKLRVRVEIKNFYHGFFHFQYWNLFSRDRSVFFNAKHIELEVKLDIYCPRLNSYDLPRPFYRRIEKLSRLARIGCLRSITISFIPRESVKQGISNILRRGCHQHVTRALEVSWRYLTEIRSIRNIFRDHLKHDISEACRRGSSFWSQGGISEASLFQLISDLSQSCIPMECLWRLWRRYREKSVASFLPMQGYAGRNMLRLKI